MLNWWVDHNYMSSTYVLHGLFSSLYVWIFGFDGV
jgi:hypothetical protein